MKQTRLKTKMEESDDDLSDEDSTDNITLVSLPCDLPTWSDISILLQQLKKSVTSRDIGQVMADLANIDKTDSNLNNLDKVNTVEYFLSEVCCEAEKTLICCVLIPAIAELALNIDKSKPYIGVLKSRVGESDVRTLHPEFLASILAHSFLSTSGRTSLNLNVLTLDPKARDTHWKLRCYFNHFHQVLNKEKHRNITFYKEQTVKYAISNRTEILNTNLVPFFAIEETQAIGKNVLRLCCCDDFKCGIITHSTPFNSEYSIKNLECVIPFLYVDELSSNESVRIDLPKNGQLSIIKTPQITRTKIGIEKAFQSFLVSMKPCTSYKENMKSVLRRPSVAAVTSADSDSEDATSSSKLSLSLSDSCMNNQTDSELSYNLSDKEKEAWKPEKAVRKSKLRRKDTFNDRLKAALERGNTPDESDDQSTNWPLKKNLPIHRKFIRRQRSTGFKAFNDNVDESDDFFTATEDDHSLAPAKSEKVTYKVTTNNVSNPLTMRRKMLQDKSFDLSTSSAQVTSSSLPVSSLQTGSSNLFSDSSSFSSEGLGMPKLEEDCMEDLCDKLTGCIETSEGGLEFRNIELRRAINVLGVRSLSDSFLSTIGDLDRLSSITRSQCAASLESKTSDCILKPSLSCPNLSSAFDWSTYSGEVSDHFTSVVTQSVASAGWTRQVWPLLLWISASAVGTVREVNFDTAGQEGLEDLGRIVDKIVSKNLKTGDLFEIICEFVRGEECDIFNFIEIKFGK